MSGVLKAVIFDVDGTLVDSVDLHAHAWVEAIRHFGYHAEFDAVRSQIGKGGDQLMPVFVPEKDLDRIEDELDHFRHELFARKYMPKVRGFHRVRGLFQHLHAEGLRIALASSAKGDELERYKRAAEITDLVDVETSSDDAERSKPHPDIFEAALERLGLPAEEAVVVGDSPWDAKAAGRAGLTVVGVLCGGFAEQDLRRAGCAEIFRDPEDLQRRFATSLIGKRSPRAMGLLQPDGPQPGRPSARGASRMGA
ncbi:HAD-IA family hydrolase [Azospirillum formosense]|uniref:HAD-IA family hydrolase n=1 Tax=Azospirillum formosense TaxID=861533 RepID=A0ABX2KQF1_9PROT|nr:HAD family hydrolase [Azospirillum formosense]MBY3752679.1 HAD family hydrolase [Azospirillum formosense]NUB18878.1 HAD-IA family hydrolase [Azospirillum formosense]